MEDHAKKCVERYCELANKTTQQLYKVSTPCLDDHQFIEEENESVGELSAVRSNCAEMFFGTLWKTRHSKVTKQTCTSSHKMTLGSFDFFNTRLKLSNIVTWETLPNNADLDCCNNNRRRTFIGETYGFQFGRVQVFLAEHVH